jgi:hypothetical protein
VITRRQQRAFFQSPRRVVGRGRASHRAGQRCRPGWRRRHGAAAGVAVAALALPIVQLQHGWCSTSRYATSSSRHAT